MEDIALKDSKLKLSNYIGYTLCDTGNSLAFSVIGSYLSRFYTNTLGIGNWAAIIQVIARIWDGINDPMMGFIAQAKKPSKNGKYRPFLIKGGIPLAFAAFFVFFNTSSFSFTVKVVFSFITYIAYGMLYTVVLVPYGSLASVMTTKENERSLLSVCRSVGGGIGNIPGGIIFPMFVFVNDEIDPNRLMIVMAIFAVLMMLMYSAGYKLTAENVQSPAEPPKVNVFKSLKDLIADKVFVIMGLVGCLLIAANMYSATVTTYMFPDYFGKSGMMMVYYIITYAPMVILVPFVNKIINKIGKKEFIICGLILSTVSSFILWIIHTDSLLTYIIINFIINAGVAFITLEIWALALDIVDHQEYVTGKRQEASTYASFTFLRKIGQAIAGIAPSVILSIGYDKGASIQSESVLKGLYNVSTFVPFLLYAIMLVLMIFYPLNKNESIKMHKILDNMRNEASDE